MTRSGRSVTFLAILVLLIVGAVSLSGTARSARKDKPSDTPAPATFPASAGRMLDQLTSDDWILRAEALTYLADHRVREALQPIREVLDDAETHPWVRGQALLSMARIEPSAVRDLVLRYAASEQPRLRLASAAAVEWLSENRRGAPQGDFDKRCDEFLERLLNDPVVEVRYRALAAQAGRRKEALWPVVDRMTRAPPPGATEWAARALAFVGNAAALERLGKLALQDESVDQVLRGISDLPRPEILPVLLKVLVTLETDDKRFANILTALQRHDRAALLAALAQSLADPTARTVQTIARVSTRLVREPELGDPLRRALKRFEDPETLEAGMVALGSREMEPDRHRDLFTRHLEHKEADIRALAIRCLAHCESVDLYDLLAARITDPVPRVVHAALNALLRAPVEHAPQGRLIAYLQVPLVSDDVDARKLAFELLGQAGTEADFAPALALLEEHLRGFNDERRKAAAEALGKIAPTAGIARVVRTQGYIANWMVVGTFLNDRDNSGFNQAYPPEKEIDFDATYQAKYIWTLDGQRRDKNNAIEREIKWSKVSVDETQGKLVLPPLMPPPSLLAVAYAVADFRVGDVREAFLSIDGDDSFRVWLNGEKISDQVSEFRHRAPCVAADTRLKVRLRGGSNRLVVKTANIEHEWWIRVRLTDNSGRPIEVQP